MCYLLPPKYFGLDHGLDQRVRRQNVDPVQTLYIPLQPVCKSVKSWQISRSTTYQVPCDHQAKGQ